MFDNEAYEKIAKSLHILNKSIVFQEQNTVKLFSYLYNLYLDSEKENESLKNSISDLEKKIIELEKVVNIHKKIPFYKRIWMSYKKKVEDKNLAKQKIEQERIEKIKQEQEAKRLKEEKKKKIKEMLNQ